MCCIEINDNNEVGALVMNSQFKVYGLQQI